MAFLCPVRLHRRGKKKKGIGNELDKELSRSNSGLGLNHGMGRITGSASIETLVRVGIEKEHGLSPDSKMIVLHDFTPCVDDELEVKRGQIVNILYRENDWVYVIGQDSRQEGFIPFSYCAPFNTQDELSIKKKLPRDQGLSSASDLITSSTNPDQTVGVIQEIMPPEILIDETTSALMGLQTSHSQASLSSEPDFLPFAKDPSGRYIVLYTFIARDENDVSVERGEFVTVLNREDPDWFWIVRTDGQEGFIPSGFVYPADNVLQGSVAKTATQCNNSDGNNNSQIPQNTQITSNNNSNPNGNGLSNANNQAVLGADDLRYHGTELVMLYDYKAQAPDDLNVRRGDWIYADLNNQTVSGWLWAYSPKTRKYGFIPKAYARPPAMTSL